MGNKQSRMRKQGIYTAPSGSYTPPTYGPAYGGTTGATSGYATYGGAPMQQQQQRSYWKPKKTGYARTYEPAYQQQQPQAQFMSYQRGPAIVTEYPLQAGAAQPTGLQYYPQTQPVTSFVQEPYGQQQQFAQPQQFAQQPPLIVRSFVEEQQQSGAATPLSAGPGTEMPYQQYDRYGQTGAGKMEAFPSAYARPRGVYAGEPYVQQAGTVAGGSSGMLTKVYREVSPAELQQQQQLQPVSQQQRSTYYTEAPQMATSSGGLFESSAVVPEQSQPPATTTGWAQPQSQASRQWGATGGLQQQQQPESAEITEIHAVSYTIQ